MVRTSLIKFSMLNQCRSTRLVNPSHRTRELIDRFVVHRRKAKIVWTKLRDVRVVVVRFPIGNSSCHQVNLEISRQYL